MSSSSDSNLACPGVIAIFLGIPGAGKSTLCESITAELIKQKSSHSSCHLSPIHLCYDLIIPDPSWIEFKSESLGCLKEEQLQTSVIDNGRNVFQKTNIYPTCGFNAENVVGIDDDSIHGELVSTSWKLKRKTIVDSVREWLDQKLDNNLECEETGAGFDSIRQAALARLGPPLSVPFVLLVDDNMYYRSMRYPFYQLARDYGLGYCSIYCSCDLESALTRNVSRFNAVPEKIITSMFSKLEPPCPGSFQWEKYSIDVTIYKDALPTGCILELLTKSFLDPVPPPVIFRSEKDKIADRTANLENFMHQADLRLRSLVSERIKTLNSDKRKQAADVFRELKLVILSDVKNGTIAANLDSLDYEISLKFENHFRLRNI